MEQWEVDRIKRAIQSCENKMKHHYEHTKNHVSNAIKNECTKIFALGKRLPKKVRRLEDLAFCPDCGEKLSKITKCCPECGQVLDWSEEK